MLALFVIYKRPTDFPHSYVLRRQVVQSDGAIARDPLPLAVELATPGGLRRVRAALPAGLTQIQGPGDDPDANIYEVWF